MSEFDIFNANKFINFLERCKQKILFFLGIKWYFLWSWNIFEGNNSKILCEHIYFRGLRYLWTNSNPTRGFDLDRTTNYIQIRNWFRKTNYVTYTCRGYIYSIDTHNFFRLHSLTLWMNCKECALPCVYIQAYESNVLWENRYISNINHTFFENCVLYFWQYFKNTSDIYFKFVTLTFK